MKFFNFEALWLERSYYATLIICVFFFSLATNEFFLGFLSGFIFHSISFFLLALLFRVSFFSYKKISVISSDSRDKEDILYNREALNFESVKAENIANIKEVIVGGFLASHGIFQGVEDDKDVYVNYVCPCCHINTRVLLRTENYKVMNIKQNNDGSDFSGKNIDKFTMNDFRVDFLVECCDKLCQLVVSRYDVFRGCMEFTAQSLYSCEFTKGANIKFRYVDLNNS